MERIELQMDKAKFDMALELRKLNRQTVLLAVSAAGIVVAAFAAGATWWGLLHH